MRINKFDGFISNGGSRKYLFFINFKMDRVRRNLFSAWRNHLKKGEIEFSFLWIVIFDFKKKKKFVQNFNVLSSGHCKNGFEMKLKLTPPPLPFLKMISRLRENCFKMCSVQSFVKIRIFKLSEFPCYKLIFEYFYELSYVYTCIYNYFDSVFRHRIVFWYFILFSIIKS